MAVIQRLMPLELDQKALRGKVTVDREGSKEWRRRNGGFAKVSQVCVRLLRREHVVCASEKPEWRKSCERL
jgi:hypothetical protein